MDIPLRGDDGDIYVDWQELARKKPTAFLDAESFSPEQRAQLVEELEKHICPHIEEPHVENVRMWPSPFDMDRSGEFDPLARFAAMNLPRLVPEPDYLLNAQMEAIMGLQMILDATDRNGEKHDGFSQFLTGEVLPKSKYNDPATLPRSILLQTIVKRGKGRKWRVVEPDSKGGRSGVPLLALWETDCERRLSPLWHAIRLLAYIAEARKAIDAGDARRAMAVGMVVGESHKALGMKLVHISDGGSKGSGPKTEETRKLIQSEADKIAADRPSIANNKSALARTIKKRLDLDLSVRTIRDKIKIGN